MMKLNLIALLLLLTACGGGGGGGTNAPAPGGNDPDPVDDLKITSFTVGGTSAPDNGISPYINNGNFTLAFDVSKRGSLFTAKAFVSINDTLSSSDVAFYDETCNDAIECGKPDYSTDCFYTNDNEIYCAEDDESFADLSPIVDIIPKSVFIIMEICYNVRQDCTTMVSPVTFE